MAGSCVGNWMQHLIDPLCVQIPFLCQLRLLLVYIDVHSAGSAILTIGILSAWGFDIFLDSILKLNPDPHLNPHLRLPG